MIQGKLYFNEEQIKELNEEIKSSFLKLKKDMNPSIDSVLCVVKDSFNKKYIVTLCDASQEICNTSVYYDSEGSEYLLDCSLRMITNYLFQKRDTCILCLPNSDLVKKVCIQIGFKFLDSYNNYVKVMIEKVTFYSKNC